MRFHEARDLLADVIVGHYDDEGEEGSVSDAILANEADFEMLVHAMLKSVNEAHDGHAEPDDLEHLWFEVAEEITDDQLDWLVYDADRPAIWLTSRVDML